MPTLKNMTKKFNVQMKRIITLRRKQIFVMWTNRVIFSSSDEAARNLRRMRGLLGCIAIRNVISNDVNST
jgi:hypothetical protein